MSEHLTRLLDSPVSVYVGAEDEVYFVPAEDEMELIDVLVGTITLPGRVHDMLLEHPYRIELERCDFIEGCYMQFVDMPGLYKLEPL